MAKKIVTGGGHAVDPGQVATVSKIGALALPGSPATYIVELHLLSGVPTAFLVFADESTRDEFFNAVVDVMGS